VDARPSEPVEVPPAIEQPAAAEQPSEQDERAATSAMNLARKLRAKNPEAYRRRLQDIVGKYPDTSTASEASKELSLSSQ
jgi:hypothetical protein